MEEGIVVLGMKRWLYDFVRFFYFYFSFHFTHICLFLVFRLLFDGLFGISLFFF